jgi:hypothetical protein
MATTTTSVAAPALYAWEPTEGVIAEACAGFRARRSERHPLEQADWCAWTFGVLPGVEIAPRD